MNEQQNLWNITARSISNRCAGSINNPGDGVNGLGGLGLSFGSDFDGLSFTVKTNMTNEEGDNLQEYEIGVVVDVTPHRTGWPRGVRVRVINPESRDGRYGSKDHTVTLRTRKNGSWDHAKFELAMANAVRDQRRATARRHTEAEQRLAEIMAERILYSTIEVGGSRQWFNGEPIEIETSVVRTNGTAKLSIEIGDLGADQYKAIMAVLGYKT